MDVEGGLVGGDGARRLGAFVRRHRDRILERWMERARSIAVARQLSWVQLRDTIPELIDDIAQATEEQPLGRHVDSAAAPLRAATSHAIDRLAVGFDLNQVFAEYTAFRLAILGRLDDGNASF